MTQVIAVSNRKGGTGKTTAAVNLSAELAARGRRVLLVDLDSQGHCATGLGLKLDRNISTAHDLFVEANARLIDSARETNCPGLFLVPADQTFEHGSGARDGQRLAEALSNPDVSANFDLVVLDTPPSLDYLLLNALTAAHWVLVPYVPHQLSFEGVKQLMRALFKIMSGANTNLQVMGFLPMMTATNIREHRTINADVARQFGALRVLPGIRNDIRLAEAFGAGKPIREYAPRCRGAEDFARLAEATIPILHLE